LPVETLWRTDFEKKCAEFPYGKHDDQVDSLSQFLDLARGCKDKGKVFDRIVSVLDTLNRANSNNSNLTKNDIKEMYRR
jgi:hypothetical protein